MRSSIIEILFAIHGFPPSHSAGAELTAYSIATFLVKQGHSVSVIAPTRKTNEPTPDFDQQGIRVYWDLPKDQWSPLFQEAHCIITHLDYTRQVVQEAKKWHKPVVHLIHNGGQLHYHNVAPQEAQLVVYNSFHLANAVRFPAPSVIVFPPVHLAEYAVDRNSQRDHYSLINLNDNKGGLLFWTLATEFPERKFLGQKGSYGDQIIPPFVPGNVTIRENSADVKRVYERTHVQLIPSKSETWGRVAIEAASNGIPIIANPAEGLMEALGVDGALWCNWARTHDWIAAIKSLDDKDTYMKYSLAGYRRAKELEQISLIQLTALESALYSISHTCRNRIFTMASEPQYLDHLAPTIHALPSEHIGFTAVINNNHTDYAKCLKSAYEHDLIVFPSTQPVTNTQELNQAFDRLGDPDTSILLTASHRDTVIARKTKLVSRLVRTEHGAGQSYADYNNPAFIGGPGHKDLLAALVPGRQQYVMLKAVEPNLPIGLIGCPKLDFWSMRRPSVATDKTRINVAISFRYNMGINLKDDFSSNKLVPEQLSAFDSFRVDVENLAADPTKRTEMAILGHGHPYAISALAPWWKGLQVPLCENWDTILEYADCLVVDNSSIAFEWLAANKVRGLKKPLILLNPPEYRRYVSHGLRFWDLEQEELVFSLNPGELTFDKIKEIVASVTEESIDPACEFFEAQPGTASFMARELLLKLAVPEDVKAKEGVRVRILKNVDLSAGFRKMGEIIWVSDTEASVLISNNLAEALDAHNPEPTIPENISLKDKQAWSVKNFSRYYQLLVPKWS